MYKIETDFPLNRKAKNAGLYKIIAERLGKVKLYGKEWQLSQCLRLVRINSFSTTAGTWTLYQISQNCAICLLAHLSTFIFHIKKTSSFISRKLPPNTRVDFVLMPRNLKQLKLTFSEINISVPKIHHITDMPIQMSPPTYALHMSNIIDIQNG